MSRWSRGGWAWPLHARQAHYFRYGLSLCRKWEHPGPYREDWEGEPLAPGECKLCNYWMLRAYMDWKYRRRRPEMRTEVGTEGRLVMPDAHEVNIHEGMRYVVEVEGEIREAFVAPREVAVGLTPNGQATVFLLADEVSQPVRPEQVRVTGRGAALVATGWEQAAKLDPGRYYFAYQGVRGSLWIGRP